MSPVEINTLEDAQEYIKFLLDELEEALGTISFLHGCLTLDGYKYTYPHQTERGLERINRILGERIPPCVHSSIRQHPECPSCVEHPERFARRERFDPQPIDS